MEKVYFTKLSGSGNDFILFDRKINPNLNLSEQKIQSICNRRTGIGADGVLIIEENANCDYEINYFNADGSTGSLCANGARSSLFYANKFGWIKTNDVKFMVNGSFYSGQIIDESSVRFFLNSPKEYKPNFRIKAAGQLIKACFINTGSPHVVINIKDILVNSANPQMAYTNLDELNVFELGKEIRYHKDFFPAGTNVNFIQLLDDRIKIRTYERGVEDETLACGTGSVACAIVSYLNKGIEPPVHLQTKGGDILTVNFIEKDNLFTELSISGSVQLVFKGEISI